MIDYPPQPQEANEVFLQNLAKDTEIYKYLNSYKYVLYKNITKIMDRDRREAIVAQIQLLDKIISDLNKLKKVDK